MTTLAFVHIEKAAGTTFIHLLRKNFLLRYMDVRPVIRHGCRYLTERDLRVLGRINPFLSCIGGHSVICYSNLDSWRTDIQFVTILREPVSRYVSQFRYWNNRLNQNMAFEQFLNNRETWNFQTKKIAGDESLELAKCWLAERFFHVGLVEYFDEFLLTLRKKLRPTVFDVSYTTRNVGDEKSFPAQYIVDKYRKEILDRNSLDLELYDFVRTNLLPKYRDQYGATLSADLAKFSDSNSTFEGRSLGLYFDYFVRKIYYQPVSGLIRILNGLPYRGSYEEY
jgi:hypothetical protein